MSQDQWIIYGLAAYILAFMAIAVGFVLWKSKRRGGRLPVDFRLLRGPGETPRRQVAKFHEDFGPMMTLAGLAPVLLGGFAYRFLRDWRPQTWLELWSWLAILAVVFLGSLTLSMVWAIRGLVRNRADRLGYLGEREVAEHLQPLLARGYRVFHDVPAEGRNSDFNLDHVAVGPGGVAVIETKTRRKGRHRSDGKDYRMTSDGETLRWPWGADTATLRQATAQADWLKRWIEQRTGLDLAVRAIVAIPGWWVEETARKSVAVVNAKSVASAVDNRGARMLTPEQIDLIARQLDERCRDVED